MLKNSASLLFLAALLSSCSSVQVKKTGNSTYFLECRSRGKCDREAENICGARQAKVMTESETYEGSNMFLFMGLWGQRPVIKQSIACEANSDFR